MRIAVVSNFYPPEAQGGAEIFAKDLCDELSRQGFQMEVFTSTTGRNRVVRDRGVVVRYFRCHPPTLPALNDVLGYNYNPWAAGLARVLARADYDLVHIHNINTTIMLRPLLRGLREPAVCHVHDHWPVCYRGILYDPYNEVRCVAESPSCCFNPGRRLIGRWNLAVRRTLLEDLKSRITLFVAPSKHMAETLVNRGFCPADKVRFVHLGTDTSTFGKPLPRRARRLLFVGRLVNYKNPSFLVSLARNHSIPPGYEVRILGNGPQMKELRVAIDRERLEKVVLLGPRPRVEVLEELRNARGIIVPSLIPENSPLVIHEALASGTPVLCSPGGGAPELVAESEAGAVVPLDDAEGWRSHLAALADDEQFNRLSSRAISYANRELEISKIGKEMAGLFESLAG